MVEQYKKAALDILGIDILPERKAEKDIVKDQKDFEAYSKVYLKKLDNTGRPKPLICLGPMAFGIKNADDAIAIASLGASSSFGTVMEVLSAKFITETLKFGGTWEVTKGSRGHWDTINTTVGGTTILTQVKASRDGMPATLHTEDLKQLIANGYKHAKVTGEKTIVALIRTTGVLVLSFDIYAGFDPTIE